MVSYVLDASAVLRFLDGEAGAERIQEIIDGHGSVPHRMLMSAVNWGEIAGVIYRTRGLQASRGALDFLALVGLEVVTATAVRAERSAFIRMNRGIPYADAFAVELAGDSSDHILVTADFDVKPAEKDVRIEFLPSKPKRT